MNLRFEQFLVFCLFIAIIAMPAMALSPSFAPPEEEDEVIILEEVTDLDENDEAIEEIAEDIEAIGGIEDIDDVEDVDEVEAIDEDIQDVGSGIEDIDDVEDVDKVEAIDEDIQDVGGGIEDIEEIEEVTGEDIIMEIEEVGDIEDIEGIEDSTGESDDELPPSGDETPATDTASTKPDKDKAPKNIRPATEEDLEAFTKTFEFHTLMMTRITGTGSDPSVFTRYRTSDPGESETIFDIPQITAMVKWKMTDRFMYFGQISFAPRMASMDQYNFHGELLFGYGDKANNEQAAFLENFLKIKLQTFANEPMHIRIGRLRPVRFAKEFTGPLYTSRYTVTPSPLSAFLRNLYVWGVDVGYGLEPGTDSIASIAVGVVNGARYYSLPFDSTGACEMECVPAFKHYWAMTDLASDPDLHNYRFQEDIGFYGYAEARNITGNIRVSVGHFNNGTQDKRNEAYETRFSMAAIEYHWKRLTFLSQWVNGQTSFHESLEISKDLFTQVSVPLLEYDAKFFLLNATLGKLHNFTVRYDVFLMDYQTLGLKPSESTAITANYSLRWTDHQRLDFEYVALDTQDWTLDDTEPDDDQWLINYTVWF